MFARHPDERPIRAVPQTEEPSEIDLRKIYCLSGDFTVSKMSRVFSLMAVLMYCSVVVHGRDNMREEPKRESPMDNNARHVRTVPVHNQLCGRILANIRPVEAGNRDEGSDNLEKIQIVQYGQVPWHVNILVKGKHRCSGVIINEFWVLTAASCVDNDSINKTLITLVVGDLRIYREDTAQQTFEVSRVEVHEDYRYETADNNIALLQVKDTNGSGIQFNSHVQPICLPQDDESPHNGDFLTISAWGDYWLSGYEDVLEAADLQVLDLEYCQKSFLMHRSFVEYGMITDHTICLGGCFERDPALWDSGAPATRSEAGVNVLYGIISTSSDPIDLCLAVFLTRVQYFRNWIITKIQDLSNSNQKAIPPRSDSSIRSAVVSD
ncbi:hypothetical protein BsWGS_27122 [Bradybaena similaris]